MQARSTEVQSMIQIALNCIKLATLTLRFIIYIYIDFTLCNFVFEILSCIEPITRTNVAVYFNLRSAHFKDILCDGAHIRHLGCAWLDIKLHANAWRGQTPVLSVFISLQHRNLRISHS